MSTLKLLNKEWKIRVPRGGEGFALGEQWVAIAAKTGESAAMRVAGAALGLCTDLGGDLKLSAFDYDMLRYGGEVYGRLRMQGVSAQDIGAAAAPCYTLLTNLIAPRESEVAAKVDFSGGGDSSTPSPSSFP